MTRQDGGPDRGRSFTEKGFYLGEFRGRTLAIVLPQGARAERACLEPVLKELEANGTDVVLIAAAPDDLTGLIAAEPIAADAKGFEGQVWRGLKRGGAVGVTVGTGADAPRTMREGALRLGLCKLVWLDPEGGLLRGDARLSFVDLDELDALVRAGLPGEPARRVGLLEQIERALRAGLPAVNLCDARGLVDELFTYAGSGTLFTRHRYVEVRRLGIDDYDAADDLVARGVSEGYLAPRDDAALDLIFANGFGAFVEGRHLAGIGALLPYASEDAGEIACLYTLTRFLGEGVGRHLVGGLCDEARARGLRFAFACTRTERVAGFFERYGFRRVSEGDVPAAKWESYDARRRPQVICLRRELC
jgi:amino-acid N-acetyltransferase